MLGLVLTVYGWWMAINEPPYTADPATEPTPVVLAEAQELQHSREMAEKLVPPEH